MVWMNNTISKIPKIWFRFSKTASNGKNLKFRWETLTEHRFEEFLDFKINYFVKNEITHVAAGIYKSSEAMEEYRKIVTKRHKDPSYHTAICCVEDGTSSIVSFDSLKLCRRDDNYFDVIHAETTEMNRFLKIVQERQKLCPVFDTMVKYKVDKYFNDVGTAIHPNYRGIGITRETALLRYTVCKANEVPLTGAWMTSGAVQRTTKNDGWKTIYKIGCEEYEKIVGVKLQNPPPFIKYKVKTI